jgi:hypothetical protein
MRVLMIVVAAILVAVVLLAITPEVMAQCAMCRASLSGSNNATFIRNLNIGVLVLLAPPVTIFCSIFVVLRRRKDQGNSDDA